MLRFVICDDNHNHNRHMAKRLAQIIFDHQVDATIELVTTDPAEVVEYSRLDIPPRDRNVYLLDINLRAESDGIEVAQQIREHDKLGYLIFITAYPEHVMRSVNLKFLKKIPLYKKLQYRQRGEGKTPRFSALNMVFMQKSSAKPPLCRY